MLNSYMQNSKHPIFSHYGDLWLASITLYEFQAIYLFSNLTIRIQFSSNIQESLIEEK